MHNKCRVVLFQAIIVFTAVYYDTPTLFSGAYTFPAWAEGIGWAIVTFCLLPLPVIFLYVMCKEGAYKVHHFHRIILPSLPFNLLSPAIGYSSDLIIFALLYSRGGNLGGTEGTVPASGVNLV